MNRPTVYITQQNPLFNYAPATKFGRLEFLWPAGYQLQANPQDAVTYLQSALSKAGRDDFLLMTGDPAIMGLASVVMTNRTGHLNILKWDNALRDYYPIEVNFDADKAAA